MKFLAFFLTSFIMTGIGGLIQFCPMSDGWRFCMVLSASTLGAGLYLFLDSEASW